MESEIVSRTRAAERREFRMILGVTTREKNENVIREKINITSLSKNIEKSKLWWNEQVKRMEQDNYTKKKIYFGYHKIKDQ